MALLAHFNKTMIVGPCTIGLYSLKMNCNDVQLAAQSVCENLDRVEDIFNLSYVDRAERPAYYIFKIGIVL